jgi:hypothetical protein
MLPDRYIRSGLIEQRRTKRFALQLPLSITRSGTDREGFAGLTSNISSCGVLFTAGRGPELGGPIEYIITLTHHGPQIVNLRCIGKVVRADPVWHDSPDQEPPAYQVAATLERYEFVRER